MWRMLACRWKAPFTIVRDLISTNTVIENQTDDGGYTETHSIALWVWLLLMI